MKLSRNTFFLACLCALVTIDSCQSQGNSTQVCKTPSPREISQKLTALQIAFQRDVAKLDLVVIVDRSQSISEKGFNKTKTTLRLLLDYLVPDGRLYFHKNYARIAVLSFGKTVTSEFDGVTDDDRTFDACETQRRIASLPPPEQQEGSTQLSSALLRARTIFGTRRNENTKQVLWIFFDGETNEEAAIKSAIDQLAGDGVIVFSAAVGAVDGEGWLDTVEKENAVRQLAKDLDHTACVEVWIDMLSSLPVASSGKWRLQQLKLNNFL